MITLEPGGPRPPTNQEKAWTRAALELAKQAESHAAAGWVLSTVLENGQIGMETDTGRAKFGNGVDTWEDLPYADARLATTKIGIVLDGLGETIQPGTYGTVVIPFDCVVTAATLTADAAGSIVVDVRKSDYSTYPATTSICAATPPTLSSAQKSRDATLTGWTTSISAGDVLQYAVVSAAAVKKVTLTLTVSIQ